MFFTSAQVWRCIYCEQRFRKDVHTHGFTRSVSALSGTVLELNFLRNDAGEMHFIPTTPDSWFNLPRKNGVAYAAQESWVQNATIRDNILFGSDFDAVRYRKVIKQCALEKDLELFEAGDQTEVGEKGLTLRFVGLTYV